MSSFSLSSPGCRRPLLSHRFFLCSCCFFFSSLSLSLARLLAFYRRICLLVPSLSLIPPPTRPPSLPFVSSLPPLPNPIYSVGLPLFCSSPLFCHHSSLPRQATCTYPPHPPSAQGGNLDMASCGREGMISSQEVKAPLEKKYGGMAPRKKPLISKDTGRAFFDSADWALWKQGAATRAAMESLRPKLQPTPHQQLPPRRPACRTVGDDQVD